MDICVWPAEYFVCGVFLALQLNVFHENSRPTQCMLEWKKSERFYNVSGGILRHAFLVSDML